MTDKEFLEKYDKLKRQHVKQREIADHFGYTEMGLYKKVKRLGYVHHDYKKELQEQRYNKYNELRSKGVQEKHIHRYLGFAQFGSVINWKKLMIKNGYEF